MISIGNIDFSVDVNRICFLKAIILPMKNCRKIKIKLGQYKQSNQLIEILLSNVFRF